VQEVSRFLAAREYGCPTRGAPDWVACAELGWSVGGLEQVLHLLE
jgi:hypothetical protein